MLTVDQAIKQILLAISDGNIVSLRGVPVQEHFQDTISTEFIKYDNGFGGYSRIGQIVEDAIKLCSNRIVIIKE